MMEVFPILFIHSQTGTVGAYEERYPTLVEAEAKIRELESEEDGFEYHTNKLVLKFNVQ